MNKPVAELRKDYAFGELCEDELRSNPFEQFQIWLNDAINANIHEPNAMTLATVTSDFKPSARMVLLKGFNEKGFLFYTNYNSRKGQELNQISFATLIFWWERLERQVRIDGAVEKVSIEVSNEYFSNRPRESQLAAWVSEQSQVISGREILEHRFQELAQKYTGHSIPRPPYWGGYCVKPIEIEFWQGRKNRLHDRLRYKFLDNGHWFVERISP